MRFIHNKMALAILCTLLSIGGSVFGYDYTFNNKTKKILMCSVKFKGASGKRFWVLLGPGQSHKMTFGPLCYSSIEVTEYDPKKALEGYMKGGTLYKDIRLGIVPVHPGGTPGGTLKLTGEYGDNSPDYIKGYFDSRIWHVPSIIYAKNPFDVKKIADAVEAIGNNKDQLGKLGELVGKLPSPGSLLPPSRGYTEEEIMRPNRPKTPAPALPGKPEPSAPGEKSDKEALDSSFGKLLGAITNLIIEGVQKGACRGHILDIYGIEVPVPGSDPKVSEKESTFIFASREN